MNRLLTRQLALAVFFGFITGAAAAVLSAPQPAGLGCVAFAGALYGMAAR